MIKIETEVNLNGTNCYVWKNYFKNDRLIGFTIIARTYTAVHFFKKNNECETRFTR